MNPTAAGSAQRESSGASFSTLLQCLQQRWVRVLLLLVCGVAARFPALQGELIWDDQLLVRDNPLIKSPLLMLETFRHYLFLDSFATHYRPVQNISYALDYLLWDTNWHGYHLSNVLWHVAGGILLYLLLETLLRGLISPRAATAAENPVPARVSATTTSAVAFLVALLWVVHPVHSAAVDYISGRADSLAFFFGCGAWLLYLRARRLTRRPWQIATYGLAALSLLLALGSREIACIWIAIFVLHLFAFERGLSRSTKWSVLGACLVVLVTYGGLRQLPAKRVSPSPSHGWSAPFRGVLMLRALGDYGRLMVFPANLHMERSVVNSEDLRSNARSGGPVRLDFLSVTGLLVAAGLLAGSVRKGRAQPVRLLGAVWFTVAYLPISNIVDLNATVAEHWLYLPSVGLLIFLAGCCLELPARSHKLVMAAACVAVLCLSARSFVRSSDWVSPEIFYERTVAAGGISARLISNLAQIYAAKGKHQEAETTFRRVLQFSPGFVMARNNLGALLISQGREAEADALFAEASATATTEKTNYPRTWVAAVNVAHGQAAAGDLAGALASFEKARLDYPGTWLVIQAQAELLQQTHGPAAAVEKVQEFADANWWHARAHLALGRLRVQLGQFAAADAAFRHASRLDVHDAEALNASADINVRENRLDEALKLQRRAVARRPDEPRQLLILAAILGKLGRTEDAQLALAEVSAMRAQAQLAVP